MPLPGAKSHSSIAYQNWFQWKNRIKTFKWIVESLIQVINWGLMRRSIVNIKREIIEERFRLKINEFLNIRTKSTENESHKLLTLPCGTTAQTVETATTLLFNRNSYIKGWMNTFSHQQISFHFNNEGNNLQVIRKWAQLTCTTYLWQTTQMTMKPQTSTSIYEAKERI